MLNEAGISDKFWPQGVHTVVHILNRALLRNNVDKTLYELWKGRPINIKHFRVFGRKCYISKFGKFDSRVDEDHWMMRIRLDFSTNE